MKVQPVLVDHPYQLSFEADNASPLVVVELVAAVAAVVVVVVAVAVDVAQQFAAEIAAIDQIEDFAVPRRFAAVVGSIVRWHPYSRSEKDIHFIIVANQED